MLDGARDADGDVEVRGDDLAGLADLPVIGGVARIDCGARGAKGGAELFGQGGEDFGELFGGAERAAARYDDLGAGKIYPTTAGAFAAHEARGAGGGVKAYRLDGGR